MQVPYKGVYSTIVLSLLKLQSLQFLYLIQKQIDVLFVINFRFRCIVPYPPNSELELELKVGDVVYVHRKREDGWYKGTLQRTGKTGLFPASFVETY